MSKVIKSFLEKVFKINYFGKFEFNIYKYNEYNLIDKDNYSVKLKMGDEVVEDIFTISDLSSVKYYLSINNIGECEITSDEALNILIFNKNEKILVLENCELAKFKNNNLDTDISYSFV